MIESDATAERLPSESCHSTYTARDPSPDASVHGREPPSAKDVAPAMLELFETDTVVTLARSSVTERVSVTFGDVVVAAPAFTDTVPTGPGSMDSLVTWVRQSPLEA